MVCAQYGIMRNVHVPDMIELNDVEAVLETMQGHLQRGDKN